LRHVADLQFKEIRLRLFQSLKMIISSKFSKFNNWINNYSIGYKQKLYSTTYIQPKLITVKKTSKEFGAIGRVGKPIVIAESKTRNRRGVGRANELKHRRKSQLIYRQYPTINFKRQKN
jgi:hypothetical protein